MLASHADHRRFRCLRTEETAPEKFVSAVTERTVADLPPGDLLIRVRYSSLNYKDALSACGNRGVTKKYPHTPGIDAVGTVETSAVDTFQPGDEVVVTSYDLGMNTDGAFSEFIRVPAAWAMPKPANLTAREIMILGTAGFTAALCLLRLESNGLRPDQGDVVVTGATGGVGTVALALLAKNGYGSVAVTGKAAEAAAQLRALGATAIFTRDELLAEAGERPLGKGRWAGGIDAVGGAHLAAIIKCVRYGGAVACCGLAGSADLATTVYPFILRGVSLLGVDSAQSPMATRTAVWEKLSNDWRLALPTELVHECGLARLPDFIEQMLAGKLHGRVVVNLQA